MTTKLTTLFALSALIFAGALHAADIPLNEGSAVTDFLLQEQNGLAENPAELTTVSSGTFKKYRFKGADDTVWTNSDSFVTIPNLSTTITTTMKDNVLLTFCGECAPVNDDESNFPVIARVNGDEMSPGGATPRYMFPSNGNSYYTSSCTSWFYKSLAAGTHTFDVQWRIDAVGETAYCRDRSIFIQYRQ